MKKTKFNLKKLVALALTAACLLGNVMTAQAATWNQNNAGWNLTKDNGQLAKSEWQLVNGAWYHFDGNGQMQTGWIQDAGKWYYLHSSGAMATGWVQDDSYWYYMDGSGAMQTMKWVGDYYVGPTGAMYTNLTTPDGVYVDASGKRTSGGSTSVGNNTNVASNQNGSGFRTERSEYVINRGAKISITVLDGDIDFAMADNEKIAKASYNPSYANRYNITATKTGSTTLTIHGTDGETTTCTIKVVDSTDTTGLNITFSDTVANELATKINNHRTSNGLNSLTNNDLAKSMAMAQIITNVRERGYNASYDMTSHNHVQNGYVMFGVTGFNDYTSSTIFDAWKGSYGHNQAMLHSNNSQIGVATAITDYGLVSVATFNLDYNSVSDYLK